jgi:hypothetical protein
MLAVSAVMMSPFISLGSLGSALHSGDGRVQAWVLAWVAYALGSGQPLFDAKMFLPVPHSRGGGFERYSHWCRNSTRRSDTLIRVSGR